MDDLVIYALKLKVGTEINEIIYHLIPLLRNSQRWLRIIKLKESIQLKSQSGNVAFLFCLEMLENICKGKLSTCPCHATIRISIAEN